MFLTHLKTLLRTAVTSTFDSDYPVDEWQGLYASIEYPERRDAYPGVWVDFEPVAMRTIGVGSFFTTDVNDEGMSNLYYTWEYSGHATFTIVALTSYERDRIFDEMVSVIAFGKTNPGKSVFRNVIVSNQYIAAEFDWDSINIQGVSQNPGTPWGSEEIVYEITISMDMIGEFNSDVSTGGLYILSAVDITATPE